MGKRVRLIQLGCAKNRVDGEWMLGTLAGKGYEVVADDGDADTIIVNTCSFLEASVTESIDTILEAARLKEQGKIQRLVVAGCLTQRYGKDLVDEMPEVDHFLGPAGIDQIVELLTREDAPRALATTPEAFHASAATPRIRTTPVHTAYLKIAEGCGRSCAFCTIPSIRGPQASRTIPDLVAEARGLAASGVRELVLVAHDLTSYGRDLRADGDGPDLGKLLEGLGGVPGLRWIRLLYAYPTAVGEHVMELLDSGAPFARYLDIPIQHASDRILRSMRRAYGRKGLLETLDRLRERVRDLTLRTTVIVGYPGETRREFDELLNLLDRYRFRWVGAFQFSPEDGTHAATLPDRTDELTARSRLDELTTCQAAITESIQRAEIGTEQWVLVEGEHPESELLGLGRTEAMAPEVDGAVILTDGHATAGELVKVRIEDAQGWDLVGAIVDDAEESPERSEDDIPTARLPRRRASNRARSKTAKSTRP
ncbi:MAG: 30S ribosomal protein S12 methylthiotransferase RimO [bacterium]